MTRFLNPPRPFYLALALFCGALLGFGYYLQFGKGLEPCPLCILQRIAYMAVLVAAVIGMGHAPTGRWHRLYDALIAAFAATGTAIASRQVWLQHLPPGQVPECGPGLDYLLEVFPLAEAVQKVFSGSGECADVDWTLMSLSIAEWSLLCFVLLAAAAVIHGFSSRRMT